jgi:hypothetical protein
MNWFLALSRSKKRGELKQDVEELKEEEDELIYGCLYIRLLYNN